MYRAVDQYGQVIDVYVSQRRDIASARKFFTAACRDPLTRIAPPFSIGRSAKTSADVSEGRVHVGLEPSILGL